MRISFYATLRKIVGTKHVDFDVSATPDLNEILSAVLEAYPALADELLDKTGGLSKHIHLFVDGRSSKWLPDGMKTRVDGSQMIEFFPAVAGG